jgi:hypothetical protein
MRMARTNGLLKKMRASRIAIFVETPDYSRALHRALRSFSPTCDIVCHIRSEYYGARMTVCTRRVRGGRGQRGRRCNETYGQISHNSGSLDVVTSQREDRTEIAR